MFENRVLRRIFGPQSNKLTGVGGYYKIRSLIHYLGDQIENNELGGACSTKGAERVCIQGFSGET